MQQNMKKLIGLCLLIPLSAIADIDVRFFNFNYENDIFYQEDGGYTNGFALNYARGFSSTFSNANTPSAFLPLINMAGFNRKEERMRGISYQVGQMMVTPEDIQAQDLIEDQQPYAGVLLGRINIYGMDYSSSRRLGIIIGAVGPPSGAEYSQKFIHSVTSSDKPQGWSHQLKTEPVFRVETAHTHKFWKTSLGGNLESDLASIGEGGIGNLLSNIAFGLRWRLGARLSDSFPMAMNLPGREVNPTAGMSGTHWQVFVNLEALYEFNNILIEGNTIRESHGVPLKHEQARLGYGAAFNFGKWAITYTGELSSRAYETQPDIGKFGSLSLTYRLR